MKTLSNKLKPSTWLGVLLVLAVSAAGIAFKFGSFAASSSLTITNPSSGQEISGDITVKVSANCDPATLCPGDARYIIFLVDNVEYSRQTSDNPRYWGSTTSYLFPWNSRNYVNGKHNLKVQIRRADNTSIIGNNIDVYTKNTIPAITSFSADKSTIIAGSNLTLSWAASNATSCTGSGGGSGWAGNKNITGSQLVNVGSQPNSSGVVQSYTLTCKNPAGSATKSLAVTVYPAVSTTLTVNTAKVNPSQNVVLTWSSTGSTACSASWTQTSLAISGSQTIGVGSSTGTRTYTVTCRNTLDTKSATVAVEVVNAVVAPVVTLSSSAASVAIGTTVRLSWSASNSPTSCSASGAWSGSKAASSSENVAVGNTAGTKTYILTCSNAGGTGSKSLSISVYFPSTAPVVSISSNVASVATGGSIRLSWAASNSPTSCSASGSWTGPKGASGSETVSAGVVVATKTYILTCSNAGGTGSKSVSVSVYLTGTPPPPTGTGSGVGTSSKPTVAPSPSQTVEVLKDLPQIVDEENTNPVNDLPGGSETVQKKSWSQIVLGWWQMFWNWL